MKGAAYANFYNRCVKEWLLVSAREKTYGSVPPWKGVSFESYGVPEEDLHNGNIRLLETDNHVVLPVYTKIRLLTTSEDVLHSWGVPSLGVKLDACPGRLNQVFFELKRPGTFYGQCSEICGALHGFMPITIKAVDPIIFAK